MHHKKIVKGKKWILISAPIFLVIMLGVFLYFYFNTWTSFSDDILTQNINDYETVVKILQEDYEKNYSDSNKQITYEFRCKNDSNYNVYATNAEYELPLSEEERKSFDVVIKTCKFAFDSTSLEYLTVDENKVVFSTLTGGGALIYSKNGIKPKNDELTALRKDNILIRKINYNWYFASVRYEL